MFFEFRSQMLKLARFPSANVSTDLPEVSTISLKWLFPEHLINRLTLFPINSNQVEVLHHPSEFYNKLKVSNIIF